MAYPGTPDEHVSLRRLAELCAECERLGLLVMAEVVPGGFGRAVPWSTENIARGARIAAELGADIVKTLAPSEPSEMEAVVGRARRRSSPSAARRWSPRTTSSTSPRRCRRRGGHHLRPQHLGLLRPGRAPEAAARRRPRGA